MHIRFMLGKKGLHETSRIAIFRFTCSSGVQSSLTPQTAISLVDARNRTQWSETDSARLDKRAGYTRAPSSAVIRAIQVSRYEAMPCFTDH